MRNKLTDLNDILFAQLERLADEELSGDAIEGEIKRSQAVVQVADKIVDNARLQLAACKMVAENEGLRTRLPSTMAISAGLKTELYPDTRTEDVARRLDRTLTTTYQHARRLGLTKTAAYLASPAACRLRRGDNVGAANRFTKGQTPANKGLRRPGFAPGRMKDTQFKAGERQGVAAKVYKPIGSERVSREGYLERKIHDGLPMQSRWRAVHLIRWEAINGQKPAGMVLKCLGDRLNTDPSNWELIPRGLLPRLNGIRGRSYDDAPAELKPTILAVAKLAHAAASQGHASGGER